MRGGTVLRGIAGTLVLGALAVVSFDRFVTTDVHVDAAAAYTRPSLAIHCIRHRLSEPEWRVEHTGENGWTAPLSSPARLVGVDLGLGFRSVPPIWSERDRAWAIVLDESRRCASDEELEEMPEWLDEASEEPPEPSHPRRYETLGDRHRHEEVLEPGSLPAEPFRFCLVEAAAGVRFCAETESQLVDRAIVPDVALVEVLDLAPRVVAGRSLVDGSSLWRTVVPEDAADVWLVRAEDGGLGLRANEDFFSLDAATGELRRVTRDGGGVCMLTSLVPMRVLGVGGGVLGMTPVHPARFVELAHTAPDGTLGECVDAADDTWVFVDAAPVAGATVAPPIRVADATAPLPGGASFHVLRPDGTLGESFSLPWARSIARTDEGLVGLTATGDVGIELDSAGLRLATPEDEPTRRHRAEPIMIE